LIFPLHTQLGIPGSGFSQPLSAFSNGAGGLIQRLMLSNFSWLEYGTFTGVSLLVYYAVILLLYYREEIRRLLSGLGTTAGNRAGVAAGSGDLVDADPAVTGADLLGKVTLEEGMSSVSMDELDFGGNDQLLQGELADCMEELAETFCLVADKGWDRKKLLSSISEIAECYGAVFASPLRAQVLSHISSECEDKLGWQISVAELEAHFRDSVPGWAKVVAGGVALFAFGVQVVLAQDGNQGIAEATNKVAGYFDTGTDLMYAIGAIMGLVGAVKVYSKWNGGEPDTAKVATAWFGSCIFLVVVATVLKSFFGI
jgi:hypothetical protein